MEKKAGGKGKMGEQTNHFKARVKIIMKRNGWSLSRLAQALDRSSPAVRDLIMRGDPKASVLKEFAEALGVAPEELLEEVTAEEYGTVFLPRFDDGDGISDSAD